jgi:hypothetical protein
MKNRDFVAYRGGLETEWIITVPATGATPRERFDDTLHCISTLFDAFTGILQPAELEFVVFDVDKDIPAEQTDVSALSKPRSQIIEVSPQDPYDDLVDAIGESPA